jgi:AcrR family transcriptional regulator
VRDWTEWSIFALSFMTKAERTKQFILERSAPIINKKGMAGTSLSDIMEATKLAKGGIYGNFGNKDEICLESFSYLVKLRASHYDKVVASATTAKNKLFSLLNAYHNLNTLQGGCPLLNFGVESDDTHPEMNARVKTAIRSSQKRIFNILNQGILDKEISPTMNPKDFSIKIFAMIEGAILLKKVLGNDEQMKVVFESIKREFESYLI